MKNNDAEAIVHFLAENEVSFSVPGKYNLPNNIVVEALSEYLQTGESSLIDKHKKWTWLCWDWEQYLKGEDPEFSCSWSSKQLKAFKKLKVFWGDIEDLDLLDQTIEAFEYKEEVRKSYTFRRKKGFTAKLRRQCLERDQYKCTGCGSLDCLEVDHIIELIDGGKNVLWNLQTLCRKCHRVKTNLSKKKRNEIKRSKRK